MKNLIVILSIFIASSSFAQRIFKTVELGDMEKVKSYVASGKALDIKKKMKVGDFQAKFYLATFAVEYKHPEIAKLLLNDDSKYSNYQEVLDQCLWEASKHGILEICQFLVDRGANLEAACEPCHKRTPLEIAIGHEQWDVANYFLEKKANVLAEDEDAINALHLVAVTENVEMAKKLIDAGLDVNSKDNEGLTPLNWAVINGNKEMYYLLVQEGGDIKTKDNEGDSLMSWAVDGGNVSIVKHLLTNGFDANGVDSEGVPYIYWAIYECNTEMVQLFIDNGADIKPYYLAEAIKQCKRDTEIRTILTDGINAQSEEEAE